MIRELVSKIKGFCRRKETEEEKRAKALMRVLRVSDQSKNAEAMLHLQELLMHEKAFELDEKRKQDYIS